MAPHDPEGSARAALRATWQLPQHAFVAGLLPAAADVGDALGAFHAVGRARMAGIDAHLLLASNAGGAGAMQVFARSIGLRHAVHFIDAVRDPATVAAGVDAWISMPGAGEDGTALDAAVAAGLHAPLVASADGLVAHGVEHGVDGIVAQGRNRIGAALLELARDPGRGRALAAAARVRYASQACRQAFAGVLRDIEARARVRCPKRRARRTLGVMWRHAWTRHTNHPHAHRWPPSGHQAIRHRITETHHLGVERHAAQRRHRIEHEPPVRVITRMNRHRGGARAPRHHHAGTARLGEPLHGARGQRNGSSGQRHAVRRTSARRAQTHERSITQVLLCEARQPARGRGPRGIHDVQQRGHGHHLRTPMPLPSSFFSCL
jgi:hypothetical protein